MLKKVSFTSHFITYLIRYDEVCVWSCVTGQKIGPEPIGKLIKFMQVIAMPQGCMMCTDISLKHTSWHNLILVQII